MFNNRNSFCKTSLATGLILLVFLSGCGGGSAGEADAQGPTETSEQSSNQSVEMLRDGIRGIPDYCLVEQRTAGSVERCLTCRKPGMDKTKCFNVEASFSTQTHCAHDAEAITCQAVSSVVRFELNEIRFDSISAYCTSPVQICEVQSNYNLYQTSFAGLTPNTNADCTQLLRGASANEVRANFSYFAESMATQATSSGGGPSTLAQTMPTAWRAPALPNELNYHIRPGAYKLCIISRDALTQPINFVNVGNKILERGEVYCEGVVTMDGQRDEVRQCYTY